jgi:hypothetical protein
MKKTEQTPNTSQSNDTQQSVNTKAFEDDYSKQFYQSIIIREYLWNCGDIDDIKEGFEMRVNTDNINFQDYEYVITLIEDFIPAELINSFAELGHKGNHFIDEYEEKINTILNESTKNILEYWKVLS